LSISLSQPNGEREGEEAMALTPRGRHRIPLKYLLASQSEADGERER
jgi:hypothetical protein